jgi:hypothetical protein
MLYDIIRPYVSAIIQGLNPSVLLKIEYDKAIFRRVMGPDGNKIYSMKGDRTFLLPSSFRRGSVITATCQADIRD